MKRNCAVFRMAMVALTATAASVGYPLAAVSAPADAASQVSPATPPPASSAPVPVVRYNVNQVVRMFQAGADQGAIIKFINDTAVPYSFSADEILYFHNLGMPPEIINALIQRGAQLQREQEVPPPVVIAESSGVPQYTYDYPYDAYFDYGWPDYFYGGPVFFGGEWGWGHGRYHGGFHHGGYGGGGFHGGRGGGGHGGGGGHR